MQQSHKTVLWVVFILSLLFLWNNWQQYNGQPAMFGGSQQAQTAQQNTASAPKDGADTSIPGAPSQAGNDAPASVPADQAEQAKAGQTITLKNDVIELGIDTIGGQVVSSKLLKHIPATPTAATWSSSPTARAASSWARPAWWASRTHPTTPRP